MQLPKLFTVCLFLLAFSSCEKESISGDGSVSAGDRASRTAICSAFSYADTIFYLRNQLFDYVVSPTKALSGTYGASPSGLSINPATGAINVSQSETGLNYKVFFVQTGTSDTCTRNVTISGIDFASSVHVLSKNDTLLMPSYKGAVSKPIGHFDITGLLSSLPIRSLGIAIDQVTATINLKQTVSNGTFGIVPINGASRTVRLYYSMDDASQGALNHIDLRLTYYDKLSDVPASLLSKVKLQSVGLGGSSTNHSLASARTDESAESTGARPPDIVIVGH